MTNWLDLYIEKAFYRLKIVLRGKAQRKVGALWDAIGVAIPLFSAPSRWI